ncbi:CHAT domain-containing protein [Actinoplanes sp. NBRC 103695]|uniref:CHAT domain-containing protein n=1 Tax=Actinoplanes sp. NBRC 103695 TaxID=3032202 RepID=UPI002556B3B8|nr:CHAT domain-containing protein [Actinoplanes sp. NBRC 103695]
MKTLRFGFGAGDSPHISISLELPGLSRHAEVPVPSVAFERSDELLVRWYLEDFRRYPAEPAPVIAARAARRLDDLGEALFDALFGTGAGADLWRAARPELSDLRIEVDPACDEAMQVPLEMLREAGSGLVPAVAARAFVHQPAGAAPVPPRRPGPLRILLAICRPRLGRDVPFRSVGGRVVALGERFPDLDVQVLRPPTFRRLSDALRDAAERGRPFDLVHLDGHGVFGTAPAADGERLPEADVTQGFFLFEDAEVAENMMPVGGARLGRLLAEYEVPLLVLNACGSARSIPAWARDESSPEPVADQRRTFGSLARAALDGGVQGVVAMRYDVYVSTAAVFVEKLYQRIVEGDEFAQAVSAARRELARPRAGERDDDWLVPAVYANGPMRMTTGAPARTAGHPARAPLAELDSADDVMLLLDRAFDGADVVHLRGLIGSGKSTVAQTFGDWYRRTGGTDTVVRVSLSDDDAVSTTGPADRALWIIDDLDVAAPWHPAGRPDGDRERLGDLIGRLAGGGAKVLLIACGGLDWLGVRASRVTTQVLTPADCSAVAAGRGAPADERSRGNLLALLGLIDGPAVTEPAVHAAARVLRHRLDVGDKQILSLVGWFHGTVSALHLSRSAARLGMPLTYEPARDLLECVADCGLLAPQPVDFYAIHPLLPAVLRAAGVGPPDPGSVGDPLSAEFDAYGHALSWGHEIGERAILPVIAADEENLLEAVPASLRSGHPEAALGPMQALRALYTGQGRPEAWLAALDLLVPAMIGPDGLPRIDLTLEAPLSATILRGYCLERATARGEADLAARIRDLLGAGRSGGEATRARVLELGTSEDEADVREAVNLANRLGDQQLEASMLIQLGHLHRRTGDARSASVARTYFLEGLRIVGDRDYAVIARAFEGLGATAIRRAEILAQEDAQRRYDAGELTSGPGSIIEIRFPPEAAELVREARRHYENAITAVAGRPDLLAPLYYSLASIERITGDLGRAADHLQQALAAYVSRGKLASAGHARHLLALIMLKAGRTEDARIYAEQAERDILAAGVTDGLDDVRQLLSGIGRSTV